MRSLKQLKFPNRLTSSIAALGFGCVVILAVPAVAQALLSADQIAAIQSSLRTVLSSARGDTALEAAIANAEQSAFTLYGAAASGAITSVVMDTAEKSNVGLCTIGKGLAQAATSIAPANLISANTIATTIANEGQALERSCFQTAANEKGFASLASIAGQSPSATGGTGGATGGIGQGGLGGGFTAGGVVGGGGGGCLNPSCTSL
jgi:hypothetical protein